MTVLRPALAATKVLLVLTLLLGIGYPALITGVGRLMPGRTDGSLLVVDGATVGSTLLGQHVTDARYFAGRPSASDYSGATSGGTNLGPNSAEQASALAARVSALRAANPDAEGPIPPDALTASASGLDPDISLAYAVWQAPRVAAASGLPTAAVRDLIAAHAAYPVLGFIGTERVNVTELNAGLAQLIDQ
jgi:K+-transporting ATPase ATPase C chain